MKILIPLCLLFLLAACSTKDHQSTIPLTPNWSPQPTENTAIIEIIGDNHPITFAEANAMLAAIGLPLAPTNRQYVTTTCAAEILKTHAPTAHNLHTTETTQNAPISYALWVEIFTQIAEYHCVELLRKNIVPAITMGAGNFFMYQQIQVLYHLGEIIAQVGVIDHSPTLHNMKITHMDNFGITLAAPDGHINFVFAQDVYKPENIQAGTNIATITIHGQEITAITLADNILRGPVENTQNGQITLAAWGTLPLCKYFTVYDQNGQILPTAQAFMHGLDIADYYILDGRVAAAIITHNTSPKTIRVAINNSNFTSLIHQNVSITSNAPFTVKTGENTQKFAPGEVFTPQAPSDTTIITPKDNHPLEIIGLNRTITPVTYAGILEIHPHPQGFIIVNQLCIEAYLYAVVPSEMPTAHGLEAAKVQAITARTFAIHQYYQNAFHHYGGAHVDDSIISQVYNNIPSTDISKKAVRATRGLVLTIPPDNGLVIANYFSTSSGSTANAGEVWASGGTFPAHTPPHLTSQSQLIDTPLPDLSIEANARQFFTTHDLNSFDSPFPWFRWQVDLSHSQLTHSINQTIASRQQATPALIRKISPNGYYTNDPITEGIGDFLSMEVISRGQGGNVMQLRITGTAATVLVQTEFNIRTLLAPLQTYVTRQDGSQINNLSLLPSGFFVITPTAYGVTLHGGGNGHGVGMSQNSVRTMVDKGWNYRQILAHFYPGTALEKYYTNKF